LLPETGKSCKMVFSNSNTPIRVTILEKSYYFNLIKVRNWSHSDNFDRLGNKLKIQYYWGQGKLGRCVIQLSKFLNHTLATHNQA
jgi:hypothetical protein